MEAKTISEPVLKSKGVLKKTDTVTATAVRRVSPITEVQLPDSATNPARWTHKRLATYIQDFESNLDNEHEIGARLVSFGSVVTFHIQGIGYYGPDIITFDGLNDAGEAVKLIQNISQLSVLLVAMKKLEEKPRRIGFRLTEEDENKQ